MKNKEEITLRQETCIYDRHAILFEEYILLFQSVTETFTSKQLTTNQHGNWFLYSLNRHCFDQVWSHNFYQSRWGESLFKQDTFYIVAGSTFEASIETVELISDLRQGDIEISGDEQRICLSASEVEKLITAKPDSC